MLPRHSPSWRRSFTGSSTRSKSSLHPVSSPKIDIHYVAHLARLSLTPEEEKSFEGQLGHVLEYIKQLEKVDVSNVEPTAHAFPLVNVTRADVVKPSLPHEEAMRNAPAQVRGLFQVPKIVE
jgi:aspartyl-tRNA(Asn)/glutamyl-tRNA(Gln) amidotransferase subunit C